MWTWKLNVLSLLAELCQEAWEVCKLSGHQAVVLNEKWWSFISFLPCKLKICHPLSSPCGHLSSRRLLLGRGEGSLPLCFLLPHTPPPRRSFASASSHPTAQELQLSFLNPYCVVLQTSGDITRHRPQWLEKALPMNLGQSSLVSPHCSGQTLREAVRPQFPWLDLIFLLLKSALTPGRTTLPLRA